jgi:hypothetical protein
VSSKHTSLATSKSTYVSGFGIGFRGRIRTTSAPFLKGPTAQRTEEAFQYLWAAIPLKMRWRRIRAMGDDVEETMFVSFVEVIEDRKGVLSGIRSMVRLHALDQCACVLLDQPNPFESVLLKISGRNVDREGREPLVGDGAGLCGERENDLVEGGPEIEQEVPQDDAAVRGGTVLPLHPEDVIAGFRVELGDDFMGFTVEESLDHALQGVEMLVRPPSFSRQSGIAPDEVGSGARDGARGEMLREAGAPK